MIRRIRRGVLPGPFINAAPGRPPGRGLISNNAERLNHEVSEAWIYRREFGTSCNVQTDSKFFWPSRPDFLPSKSANAVNRTLSDRKERTQRMAKSIRRFRPIGSARISLPPPEGITYSHAPLYTSIAKMEVDPAWIHFVSHLKDLSDNKAAPLDSALFDALFWLIATENFTSMSRHEEVFGRAQILLLYASSQVDYGLTRLQLHRTVYIWTTLWEQYEVKGILFPQVKFKDTILGYLNEITGRLVSRVLTRMLNDCATPEELAETTEKIKSWLKEGECKVTRQEVWASTSRLEFPNDDAYFQEEDHGALDSQMWDLMLARCFEIGICQETVNAGMLALQQAQLDLSSDYVSQFLAFLETDQLYDLLPIEVRKGSATINNVIPAPLLDKSVIASSPNEDHTLTKDDRSRLVYAIAFVLATRLHYLPALYLYELEKQKDEKLQRTAKTLEVYAAAANACARLVLEPTSWVASKRPKWNLIHLQRGLRLFTDCEWHKSRARNATAKLFVDAIWLCIILNKKTAAVQSNAQWLLLLRQFTTVLLIHNPNLSTLEFDQDHLSYSRLLSMHINLQDYPFAKRLFLVKMTHDRQGDTTVPFIPQDDFCWLFTQSFAQEQDVRFSDQLFLYWTCLEVGHSEQDNWKSLPPIVLRMYFNKIKASGREGSAVRMLYENFDLQDINARAEQRRHFIKMMQSIFAVGRDYLDFSLSMASDLLKYWIEKKKRKSTLIRLYSIAMRGSTRWIDQSDALLRSSIMNIFRLFQQHTGGFSRNVRAVLTRKCNEDVKEIYICALKTLVEEKETLLCGERAEEWIKEVQEKWGINDIGGQLCSMRIAAHLVGSDADIDLAKALYDEAIKTLGRADSEVEGKGEPRMEVLSASVTSSLMTALAKRGDYKDALKYVDVYQAHASPLSPDQTAFIQGAHIAILHMQGNVQEALQKLKVLKESRSGRGREKHANAEWLQTVDKAIAGFRVQLESQDVVEYQQQEQYILSVAMKEEEQQRGRVFGAMASGQPCRKNV